MKPLLPTNVGEYRDSWKHRVPRIGDGWVLNAKQGIYHRRLGKHSRRGGRENLRWKRMTCSNIFWAWDSYYNHKCAPLWDAGTMSALEKVYQYSGIAGVGSYEPYSSLMSYFNRHTQFGKSFVSIRYQWIVQSSCHANSLG